MRVLLSLAVIALTLGCSNAQDAKGQFDNVTVEQAKTIIAETSDLQIIDVRTDGECEAGMIEGAVQMDISAKGFSSQLETLDKEKPVLVYCAAGGRSSRAQSMMQTMGFKTVHNLEGGFTAWSAME